MQVLWTHISANNPSLKLVMSMIDIGKSARSYLESMDKKIAHEGKARSCEHYKLLHMCSIKIVSRDAIPKIPFCKVGKDGIPLELNPVKHLLLSPHSDIQRFGLTITRFYEKIVLPKKWDPTPITSVGPDLPDHLVQDFSKFCSWWTDKLGIRNLSLPIYDDIRGSLTQGPNGPSVMSSHIDAIAVMAQEEVWQNLQKLASLTGREDLISRIKLLAKPELCDSPLSGRIALLQQGGGKTRTIAIGDFWSQNLLRPIHDKIMSILKKMVTDGTYDQDDQVGRISRESLGHKTFSYDLSSATDRFPVKLQEILLSHMFGEEMASTWRKVLTSRDYQYCNEHVRWGAGQPLGLLSSWAVFALTHHAIIEFCAWQEGRTTFKSYAVLGDDVAIWDEAIATRYKDLLQLIDVKINWNKSLISDNLTHRVEFAKRIIVNGTEVTGLKWDILHLASTSIYMLVDLIRVAKLRSWNLSWSEFEAPSFLNEVGKELLSVLMWDSSGLGPPYLKGKAFSSLTIQEFRRQILKTRIDSLKDKRDSLMEIYSKRKSVAKLFQGGGIAYSETLIGSREWLGWHPITEIINQQSKALFEALESLEDILDDEDGNIPSELPVEYLPLPDASVYFGQRHRLRAKKHGQLVLRTWTRIKLEAQLTNTSVRD